MPSAGATAAAYGSDLALADDGTLAVGWDGTVAGVRRPQIAVRPPGGIFGPAQTLIDSGPALSEPVAMAASARGTIVAAFATAAAGKDAVMGTAAAPGSAFAMPVALAGDLQGGPLVLRLAVSPAGDGVAVWQPFLGSPAAAEYDVSGPVLRSVTIPGTGTAGVPVTFGVQPVDIWSALASTSWAFGDGGTGLGPTLDHTFAGPGAQTAAVTATDALGNATSASAPLAIATAPGPVIEGFSVVRRAFAVTTKPAASAARKVARGTRFRVGLSAASSTVIKISITASGLLSGGRCRRSTGTLLAKLRQANGSDGVRRAACTLRIPVGSLKRSLPAGASSVPFDGWVGKRPLKPAGYQAQITATDARGLKASRGGVAFRIVRAG